MVSPMNSKYEKPRSGSESDFINNSEIFCNSLGDTTVKSSVSNQSIVISGKVESKSKGGDILEAFASIKEDSSDLSEHDYSHNAKFLQELTVKTRDRFYSIEEKFNPKREKSIDIGEEKSFKFGINYPISNDWQKTTSTHPDGFN